MPRQFTLCCVLCVSAVSPRWLLAQDDAVLQQLRQRGDHPAIERYCRQELKAAASADRRAELVAELAGSLAQQAILANEMDRNEALWAEAAQLIADFRKSHPDHPRGLLMLRQCMIYAFTHGDQLRQQALISESSPDFSAAKQQLVAAELHALELEKAVRQALDAYNARTSKMPFAQLVSLSNDVPFRLGQIRLSLAQTREERAPERTRLLAEASKHFEFYTREGYSDDELIIRAHLGLAECRRMQGEAERAVRLLTLIEKAKATPQALKDEASALHVHVLLDQNQPQAARALLRGGTKLPAELALADVRTGLLEAQQCKKQGDGPAARRLQAAALQSVVQSEAEHGATWSPRADALLATLGEVELLQDDWRQAERLATALHRRGRTREAGKAYERAGKLARTAGQADRAFDLELIGIRLLGGEGRESDFAELLQQLARAAPTPAKEAQVSLLAAQALARHWEKDRSITAMKLFTAHATSHAQRFSGDASTLEVRFLQGQVEASTGNMATAISCFEKLPVSDERTVLAVQFLAATIIAQRQTRLTEEAAGLTSQGLAYFATVRHGLREPKHAPRLLNVIELCSARLRVWPSASKSDLEVACEQLAAFLKLPENPQTETTQARQTLAIALAALGKSAEATRPFAAQFSSLEAKQLHTELTDWLMRLPEDRQRHFAPLQLLAVRKLLDSASLDTAEGLAWQMDEAWALARAGQTDEARARMTNLRRLAPRDATLAESHARLLMLLGTEKDLSDAIALWQTLAGSRSEGAQPWFEAKYQLATCYGRLRQKDRALKVLKLTCELWLNDAEAERDEIRRRFKRQFAELERELSR